MMGMVYPFELSVNTESLEGYVVLYEEAMSYVKYMPKGSVYLRIFWQIYSERVYGLLS
ncbi:hypothetical protein KUL42_23240 [Alteromonas sp. KUL42]|nr:hypothetical protein KUL42_23240 [Alteromonas sp. KUL42]